jgi:hypothetical protein
MTWEMKGIGGSPLSILRTFYRQRVLMTLLCAHVVSVLKDVIAISEGFSKLNILSKYPPFLYVFHDM